jgi:spore coat polysaccharide biosynthesis protein SpsF
MNKKDVICIIQARISSSRLPGKILLPGYDKPLLLHTINRLKKSKLISKIVVATTNLKIDDAIVNLCKKNNVLFFRGHPTNVLNRYYKCAINYKAKNILRITSDCPLIDYKLVDKVIKKFFSSEVDYVSNMHPSTFPDGFAAEVFTIKSLRKAFFNAKKYFDKEHVTPFIWKKSNKFKIDNYTETPIKNYYKKYRFALDYIEDFYVIWNIYNELYPKKKFFDLKDILRYVKSKNKILLNRKYLKIKK